MALQRQHRETLAVLGYLYLRLGETERAGRLFKALIGLMDAARDESGASASSESLLRLAHASMATVELEHEDPAAALTHLHHALDGQVMSSKNAALHLLRARALWKQNRQDEAKQAVDTFIHLAGGARGAREDDSAMQRFLSAPKGVE